MRRETHFREVDGGERGADEKGVGVKLETSASRLAADNARANMTSLDVLEAQDCQFKTE